MKSYKGPVSPLSSPPSTRLEDEGCSLVRCGMTKVLARQYTHSGPS